MAAARFAAVAASAEICFGEDEERTLAIEIPSFHQLVRRLIAHVAMIAIVAAAVSCRKSETVLDAVHQTLEQVRPKTRVEVDIVTEKPQPSAAELQLQQAIEKRVEQERIATLINDGSGPGYVRINLQIGDAPDSIARLRALLHEFGVLERSSVKIVAPQP